MNRAAKRGIGVWVITTGFIAVLFLVVFPMFDLLPWIRLNGVIWFGAFNGAVLAIVYVILSAMGYTAGGGGARTAGGGDAYDSKGAGKR